MYKSRATQLVCHHGRTLEHCPICPPQQSARDYTGLNRPLEELLAAARPRLLHLTQLNGIGLHAAEDVVQETLLEAWRQIEKLREPERLTAWLDGICRNICKRHLRAQTTTPRTCALPGNEEESASMPLDLADPLALDPAAELEHEDLQLLLDRALGYLSEGARELIELCYLVELPQREVAQRLDISVGALEQKLHRARHQLRQVLNGELRTDAQEFGLQLDKDEGMGWQETRQWCWLCGTHRLRGLFEPHSQGIVTLRLRCPACCSNIKFDITHVELAGPVRSFRPAFKRAFQAVANFYDTVLLQRVCNICQSPIHMQIIDLCASRASSSIYDTLPPGIYLRTDCPRCGTFCSMLLSALMSHTTVRDFLLNRPRALYESTTFITFSSQKALRLRLIDLASSAVLAVIVHPETLQVMATLQE